MNVCVCIPTKGHVRLGTHVLSVTQVGRAGGCGNFAGRLWCGLSCLVFLVPVDSDVVLTASVVLRAKGSP